ncbi:hypothetical protein E4U41_003128 [Claviceps citrina]|nr:hypothetical protein E4U41_003128 [Claviceps citrina]
MRSLLFLLLPVWTGSFVSASPLPADAPVADERRSGSKGTCTFTNPADVLKKKFSCSTIILKNMFVPAGVTLNMNDLKDNTHVIFDGKMTFGYKEWAGPLINIAGNNILIEGTPNSVLDGQGQRWWDNKGTNGGKKKPQFFNAHNLVNSNIRNLNLLNTPAHSMSISASTTLGIFNVTIDNRLGDTKGGHNTDGFDVGTSTGVYISGARVWNQDDCLAINSGSNITFTDGFCSGGHGLSIGSVGAKSDNQVKDVKILNSKVVNSQNGIRIKTIAGGKGLVSDVTYDNIVLSDIEQYGIVIQQDYLNGRPTGKPTKGVPIKNLTVSKVTGNVKAGGTNVYVLCGNCEKWNWSENKVVDGTKAKLNAAVPAGVAL